MPYLDLHYLQENVSSDEEFIRQLLRVFIDSTEDDLMPLKKAMEEGNHENIKRSAHKIKSSFRSLGMREVTELFQQLEDKAREGETIEAIRQLYAQFLRVFPEIKHEVETRLAQGK